MNEDMEHSKQDAQDFLLQADSYLLLTLNGEILKNAGYADNLDQLFMLLNYLNTKPSLMRALCTLLPTHTTETQIGEN